MFLHSSRLFKLNHFPKYDFLPRVSETFQGIQRRIQNAVKHLRWSVLRNAPSYMSVRVLDISLEFTSTASFQENI